MKSPSFGGDIRNEYRTALIKWLDSLKGEDDIDNI